MSQRGVSSVIGGLLVILIALTSVGTITSDYFWGVHTIIDENQLTQFLTLKDEEYLSIMYNGSVVVKNEWSHPSLITYIVLAPKNSPPSFIPESIPIYPDQQITFKLSSNSDPVAVLTSYGNEFWVSYPSIYFETYSVNIVAGSGGTTSPSPGTYYYPYGSIVKITAIPNSGYTFSGWQGTGYGLYTGSNNPATIYTWSNISETAIFLLPLTVSITANPTSGNAPLTVSFSALASGGSPPYSYSWNFGDGQTSNTGATSTTTHTYSSPGTYTATVTVTDSAGNKASASTTITVTTPPPPNSYTVTFDSSPASGAPVTISYNGQKLSETTPYSITVSNGTSISYSYASSYSGGTGIQYVNPNPSSGSITVTQDITINAQYTTQYYLTMQANPSSGGSVSPSSGWYNAGFSVQISATANSWYEFTGWSGFGSGSYSGSSSSTTITMNGPITEIANFVALGQVEFEAYDYGTNYQVGAILYLTSSSGMQYSDPSWTTITIPVGTYSLSYSNSQYGAGVYNPAQSPIYVSQGQTTPVSVLYYTPTNISENVRIIPGQVSVWGQVTTADGGNVGANYAVNINVTFSPWNDFCWLCCIVLRKPKKRVCAFLCDGLKKHGFTHGVWRRAERGRTARFSSTH